MPMEGLTNGTVPRAVLLDQYGREIRPAGNADPDERTDGLNLPHVLTFASMYRGAAFTYNHLWDEAMKHSRMNAMAMRRDAWLMALLRERADETLAKPWHLEVDNPRDKWQKTVRDGMTQIIKGIYRLKRLQRYLLQGGLWYGRYGANLKWAWREMYLPLMQSKAGMATGATWAKGKVLTIVKHKPVNGDKIGHHVDDTPYVLVNSSWTEKIRGEAQIIYPTSAQGPALLLRGTWREQILIHTSDPDDGDYFDAEMAEGVHGVGIRSRIYWLDFLRRDYFGAVTEMLNRIGLGLVVIYYDASNNAAKQEALHMAKNFSRRSVIVMPRTNDGVSQAGAVEVVETPMAGAQVMLELQKHVEDQIERYMIFQGISAGGGTSNPLEGTGRSEFAKDTKSKGCLADAYDHDETWTGSEEEPGPVSIIKKWTYSYADFPVRYVTDHEEENVADRLEAIKTYVDMGGEVPDEPVREMVGVRAAEAGEKTLGGKDEMMNKLELEAEAKGQPFGAEGAKPKSPHGDDEWHDEMKKTLGTEKPSKEESTNYADLLGSDYPDKPFEPNPDVDGGRWVTMGAKYGHGGSKVYIVEGRIMIGHPNLMGKRIDALKEHGTGNPEIQRAWHKKAKDENLDAKSVHQLAAEFLAHDRESKKDVVSMIKNAQDAAKGMRIWGKHSGYDLRAAVRNATKKGKDYNDIPGFDQVAEEMANSKEFGYMFSPETSAEDQLWDYLLGDHAPMSEEDAYAQAFDHVKGASMVQGELEGDGEAVAVGAEEEEVPFASDEMTFTYAADNLSVHEILERIRKMGVRAAHAHGFIEGILALLENQPHLRRHLTPEDLIFIQTLAMSPVEQHGSVFANF